jgi:hypothetical protein
LKTGQLYYELGTNKIKISNQWYLHSDIPQSLFPKDLLTATLNNQLHTISTDNKPGYLQVAAETNKILEFGMLPRKYEPLNVPYTDYNQPSRTYIPGFYYKTDCGIYITKLNNIKVINDQSGK